MPKTNPPTMTQGRANLPVGVPTQVIEYNDQTIHFTEEMNLTEMWKASGNSKIKKPYNWIRYEGARFIERMMIDTSCALPLIRTTIGRNGATFAHWQIAMAYAHYLSPAFAMICNQIVLDFLDAKPEIAVSVIRRATPSAVARIMATAIDHTNDPEGLAIIQNRAASKRAYLEQGGDLADYSEAHMPLALDPQDAAILDCLEALHIKKLRQSNAEGHDEILSVIQPVAEAFQQMTAKLGVQYEGQF